MKAPLDAPVKQVSLYEVEHRAADAFLSVLRIVDQVQIALSRAINFNEITYVSQNARPTPAEGATMVWKDADAGAGQPKAYIVTTQGGVTYTFASVETV